MTCFVKSFTNGFESWWLTELIVKVFSILGFANTLNSPPKQWFVFKLTDQI